MIGAFERKRENNFVSSVEIQFLNDMTPQEPDQVNVLSLYNNPTDASKVFIPEGDGQVKGFSTQAPDLILDGIPIGEGESRKAGIRKPLLKTYRRLSGKSSDARELAQYKFSEDRDPQVR
jgi:hypothetical protein